MYSRRGAYARPDCSWSRALGLNVQFADDPRKRKKGQRIFGPDIRT
jgi:hypothetical protein